MVTNYEIIDMIYSTFNSAILTRIRKSSVRYTEYIYIYIYTSIYILRLGGLHPYKLSGLVRYERATIYELNYTPF